MTRVDMDDLVMEGWTPVERDYSEMERAGVEHYCFACAKGNPASLGLQFHEREEDPCRVITRYVVSKEHCGFPAYAHGGILATILDEAMALATYRVENRFGVTKSMNIEFKQPVLVESPIFVEGRVVDSTKKGNKIIVHASASINDGMGSTGKTCTMATAVIIILPPEVFQDAIVKRKQGGHHDE